MVKKSGGALLLALKIDHAAPRSLSTQLLVALREMILSGGLRAGDRLPATRTIAKDLGVSRTTVVEAFERLAAEGLIVSRTGAGSFVSQALARQQTIRRKLRQHASSEIAREAAAGARHGARLVRLLRATAAHTARLHHRASGLRRLSDGALVPPRREALARAPRRGDGLRKRARLLPAAASDRRPPSRQSRHIVRTRADFRRQRRPARFSADQQHAARSGRSASGSRTPARSARATVLPRRAPSSNQFRSMPKGLSSKKVCGSAPHFRLAFVTPSHQQPLGSTMSLSRRFALLAAAEAARRLDRRRRLRRRVLLSRPSAADAEEHRCVRPRHLCRHVQQDALSRAPPRLHPVAAGSGRHVRALHGGILHRRPLKSAGRRRGLHGRRAFLHAHPPHAKTLRGTPRRASGGSAETALGSDRGRPHRHGAAHGRVPAAGDLGERRCRAGVGARPDRGAAWPLHDRANCR